MRILLIGREGQVGWELRRTLACLGEVVALDRHTEPRVDLAEPAGLEAVVRELAPALIVNAAAHTAVDRAEEEPELALRVNGEAPGVLAEAARAVGAGLIHYSTDYVYDGSATTPYREDAPTAPLGSYGRSKLAGERAIAEVGAPHLILRTAWVYGSRGKNFLLTMLRLLGEREVLRVVDDQIGAPTWSRLIAEATALLALACRHDGRFEPAERSGIYHLSCGGATTWHGFAAAIRQWGLATGLLGESAARLEPIATSDYPTPARRPAYSVLDNHRLEATFGLRLPHWQTALELCIAGHPKAPASV